MSHNLELFSFQKMCSLLGFIRKMKALQRSARGWSWRVADTLSGTNQQMLSVRSLSLFYGWHFSYSLFLTTVNTRENFWNVYCFATRQMRDETVKDNRQTAALISHDLTWNNELAFSSTRNLQFYRFQIPKFFFLNFGFGIPKASRYEWNFMEKRC